MDGRTIIRSVLFNSFFLELMFRVFTWCIISQLKYKTCGFEGRCLVMAWGKWLCYAWDVSKRKNGKIRKWDPFSDFSQGACVEQRENLKEARKSIQHPISANFVPNPRLFYFPTLMPCEKTLSGASLKDPVTNTLTTHKPNSSQMITVILFDLPKSPYNQLCMDCWLRQSAYLYRFDTLL